MFNILAQSGGSIDWVPVVVQAGFAGFAAVLLRWVMTTLTERINEVRAGQDEIRDALNHLTESNLIQLLAHPSLSDSAKQLADNAMRKLEAAKSEYKR